MSNDAKYEKERLLKKEFIDLAYPFFFGDDPNATMEELAQKYDVSVSNLDEMGRIYYFRETLAFMAILVLAGIEWPRKEVAQAVRHRPPKLPIPEILIIYLCDGYIETRLRKKGKKGAPRPIFGNIENNFRNLKIQRDANLAKKDGLKNHEIHEELSEKFHLTQESIANLLSKLTKADSGKDPLPLEYVPEKYKKNLKN
ncbi:MAG: hypothetical protein KJ658_05170 [Proteobacteria bacterium]|nr:hypothetical protein [Desulfobacula sp.]MBU3951509.1 hypothetical protein [Pseudomonadota bacterium]